MPEPTPNEDLAVRYLLGELEGPDKSRFEAELAASPSLRAQLQELEAACDALALSAPARRPPQRVWKAITRAIGPSETRAPLPSKRTLPEAWLPAREWFWRLAWAAAACCITLWVVRTPSDTPSSPGDFAGADPGPAPSSAHPNPLAPRQPGPSSQSADGPARAPARPDSQLAGTRLSEQEWIELRRRLQELGVLNQSLSQQLALPPGAARFQVFRLSPTNTGGIAATQSSANLMAHSEHDASTAEATALQNLLTQALARELAANTIKSPPASASSSADTLAQGPGQGTTTGSSSSSGTAPSSSSTPSAGDTTSPADATSTTVASRTPDKTTP
ncbi:MAG: hypothetical protein JNL97_01185, partial [Verrucomicrobiales bacterium]|nr:hypothetical protein [Verrucomicrobiales bacterium]